MFYARLKVVAAILLAVSLFGSATGVALWQAFAGEPPAKPAAEEPVRISGVYPHWGVNGGDECGIGTLAPFVGKLWFNWYGSGGGGELYSVDEQLKLTAHLRGVPGLGDRMIHPESDQLFIAGCVVNNQGVARKLTGTQFRCPAAARHLTDPARPTQVAGTNLIGTTEQPSDVYWDTWLADSKLPKAYGCGKLLNGGFGLRTSGPVACVNRFWVQSHVHLYCIGDPAVKYDWNPAPRPDAVTQTLKQ